MNSKELEMLFKANAEINSQEAYEEREKAHKIQALYESNRHADAEPIEVMRSISYIETAEFMEQMQDIVQTEAELKQQIQSLRSELESERKSRQESEAINTRFQWANLTLVALTLIATIIFGLGFRSCASAPIDDTSETSESGFAGRDLVPAVQS